MPVTSTLLTPFTWTSAPETWDSTDAAKTWDTYATYNYDNVIDEAFGIAEQIKKVVGKNVAETLLFAETSSTKSLDKNIAEALGVAEADAVDFSKALTEAFTTVDAISKNVDRGFDEAFSITEASSREYELNKPEAVAFAEVFARVVAWSRVLAETTNFAEAIAKNPTKKLAEVFSMYDTLIRQGPAVINDMQLRSDEIDFDAFVLVVGGGVPSGFGPFQPFVAGDYDLTRALIKITLTRENPQQQLRLLTGKVFVDVPDVTDRGSVNVVSTAAPYDIVFTRKFLIPPEISITQLGTVGAAVPQITNITRTGFSLELIVGGSRTTGSASWLAEGY